MKEKQCWICENKFSKDGNGNLYCNNKNCTNYNFIVSNPIIR